MRPRTTRLAALLAFACAVAPFAHAHAADRVGSAFADSAAAVRARPASPDTGQHLAFRWTPAPRERCDWFPVFEAGVSRVGISAQDWVDQTLFTNSLGLMHNVSERDAVGASLDAHWMTGVVTLTPTVRWRRFVGRTGSVEASLGWVDNHGEGAHGPITQLRYAPVPQAAVQVGTLQYRRELWEAYELGWPVTPRVVSDTRVFGGFTLAGRPASVAWATEGIALGFVLLMISKMD